MSRIIPRDAGLLTADAGAGQAFPAQSVPGAPIRPLAAGSAEYRRDYNNGWRVSQRCTEGAEDRADGRNVSHAWHDGYEDYAVGNPKWTKRDERLAGDHEPEPADPCEAAAPRAGISADGAIGTTGPQSSPEVIWVPPPDDEGQPWKAARKTSARARRPAGGQPQRQARGR